MVFVWVFTSWFSLELFFSLQVYQYHITVVVVLLESENHNCSDIWENGMKYFSFFKRHVWCLKLTDFAFTMKCLEQSEAKHEHTEKLCNVILGNPTLLYLKLCLSLSVPLSLCPPLSLFPYLCVSFFLFPFLCLIIFVFHSFSNLFLLIAPLFLFLCPHVGLMFDPSFWLFLLWLSPITSHTGTFQPHASYRICRRSLSATIYLPFLLVLSIILLGMSFSEWKHL
jgi:hypothetical protein